MTARGGFHGRFEPSGTARQPGFAASLAPLQFAAPPFWAAAWSAAGPQAVCAAEGPRALLFLGELYNLDALRAQLGADEALPLPALLLQAQARWSFDFVHRLDGQFALALRDADCLSLYRDGSAAHNLYYSTQDRGQLSFATGLATLLQLPDVDARLSRPALHEYLRFLDIAAPRTVYEGIHALEAGQWLSWTADGISHPAAGAQPAAPTPAYEEALATLEDLLHASVARRLHGVEAPAAFLSGGIDSSLTCAFAARVAPHTRAVTVGFEGPLYDETPLARLIAAHLGMTHEVLRFSPQDYQDAFARFQQGAEQPVADPAAPATLLAFDYCKDRFDAVLDGSGADESAGLTPPRHVRAAIEYASLLPARLRALITGSLRRLPGLDGYAPIFDFEHPAEPLIRWHGFTRAEIEALCGEPVSLEQTRFYQNFARYPRHAHFERSVALLDSMPGDRLHQAAALSGLRVRYPFCDPALDRYIRSLPPDYRYRPDAPKRILRSLLARHVPRSLWDVPKHGFDFPLLAFLQAEDFQLVRRYLLQDQASRWQPLVPERVADYAHRFMAGESRLLFRVWALVVLAAWLENRPA